MKTTLLLARHGNTFRKGETVLRIGGRTNLPLVESKLSTALGKYLKDTDLIPDVIYAAPLKRTMQTAQQVVKAINTQQAVAIHSFQTESQYGLPRVCCADSRNDGATANDFHSDNGRAGNNIKIIPDNRLIEIDYGVDDGKPEEDVIARLGVEVIENWNKHAIVPNGWNVNPKSIIDMWHKIAYEVEELHKGQKVLIVTSNGLLRFAPYITGDFKSFSQQHDLKVATGAFCVFEKLPISKAWSCVMWNSRPSL